MRCGTFTLRGSDFAKALLQVFEQSSPSSSQVKELAERIARDNGIRQNSGPHSYIPVSAASSASCLREPLTLVPVNRLDSISTKCMEDYFKKAPLSSREQDNIRQGFYVVTEADLILAQRQGSDAFWESVIQDSRDRERTLNARKLCEMNTDARSFRASDKILVASERALQDALHKHSSEMREIYPLCQRAGVSSGDADKFMALLFLCHDFYNLPNLNIDGDFIKEMSQDEARDMWDTVRQAHTKDGVGKVVRKKDEIEKAIKMQREQRVSAMVPMVGPILNHISPEVPAWPEFKAMEHELMVKTHPYSSEYPKPYLPRKSGDQFTISDSAIQELIIREGGFYDQVYSTLNPKSKPLRILNSSNDLTIGLGHSLQDENELSKYWPKGEKRRIISQQEAEDIFRKDLDKFTKAVNHAFKNILLTQNQFDAFVMYSFNRGENIFSQGNSGYSILQAMQKEDIQKAENLLRNSIPAVKESNKKFQTGWTNRRAAEADLFLKEY